MLFSMREVFWSAAGNPVGKFETARAKAKPGFGYTARPL
jgi:hypothetical protein